MYASHEPVSPGCLPLKVLLVCPRGEYVDSMRKLARNLLPDTQVLWVDNADEAVRRANHAAPQLAIVDARLDRASGSSLARQLEDCGGGIDGMRFDEPQATAVRENSVWHWSELPRAVAWWVRHQRLPVPALLAR